MEAEFPVGPNLMSLLSRLFGGGAPKEAAEPEIYEGFSITPKPMSAGGEFRISAMIEKEVDGETKSHHLIRADTMSDLEAAKEASVNKAKVMIDQQGERLFD